MNDQQHEHDEAERAKRSKETAAAARIQFQSQWVEQQLRIAQERGDFDNLPGAGKPIEGLGSDHDPDWWLKKLIEREHISVLPPALALRKEDAELDDRLDAMTTETEVRREVEDFNARVLHARYTPVDGPPLITMPRDVDADARGVAGASYGPGRGAARGARRRAGAPPRRGLVAAPFLVPVWDDAARQRSYPEAWAQRPGHRRTGARSSRSWPPRRASCPTRRSRHPRARTLVARQCSGVDPDRGARLPPPGRCR